MDSPGAAEATIAIGLDLYIGLNVASLWLPRDEVKIFDGEATAQPLALIVGLYTEDLILERSVIEVFLIGDDLLAIQRNKGLGVGIEEGTIGLEVNRATGVKHLEMKREEVRRLVTFFI